jgi:hypothetical protein
MILEETSGDVLVTIEGKKLVVGTYFDDSIYPIVLVTGTGKAIFRVDPSTTTERNGVPVLEAMGRGEGIPTPPPVKATPVVEQVTPPMETSSEPTKEA